MKLQPAWAPAASLLLLCPIQAQVNLYVCEYYGDVVARVVQFDGANGIYQGEFRTIGEGVTGVTFGRDGLLYAVEKSVGYGAVHRWDPASGAYLGLFTGPRDPMTDDPPTYPIPTGLALGPSGDLYLLSVDWLGPTGGLGRGGQVFRIDRRTGEMVGGAPFVPPGTRGLRYPEDLEFGPGGILFIADRSAGVLRFDGWTGSFLGPVVSNGAYGIVAPSALAFDSSNRLYVFDSASLQIHQFQANGRYLGRFATSPHELADIEFLPDGDLLATSTPLDTVVRFDRQTGAYLGEFTPGGARYFPEPFPGHDATFGPVDFFISGHTIPEPKPSATALLFLSGAIFAEFRLRHRKVARAT
jgi:hypothetical protein